MALSYAHIRTSNAGEYLVRLSGGLFAKSPALMRSEKRALIRLPNASCELTAGDGFLDITLTAASKDYAALLEDVVADGLDGIARDEELKYQWVLQ